MTCQTNNNVLSQIMEVILNEGMEGLNKAISILINEAMQVERSRHLNAEPYARTEQRKDYANGFKDKHVKTRVGELALYCLRYPKSGKLVMFI